MNLKEMFGRFNGNHVYNEDDLRRNLELSRTRKYSNYQLAAFLRHYEQGIKVNGSFLLGGLGVIGLFRDFPAVYPFFGGITASIRFLKDDLEGVTNCLQVANERGLEIRNGLLFPSIILSDSDPEAFFERFH